MKKIGLSFIFSFLSLIVVLNSCVEKTGQGLGTQLTFSLSPSDINTFLKREFPVEKEFDLGKLILSDAEVSSIKSKDKIKLGLDVAYKPPLIPTTIKGGVKVIGGIKYDPKKKALFLKDPMVQEIKFWNKSFSLPKEIQGVVGGFVGEVFNNIPIYKFSGGNLATYLLKDVRVEDGKIKVSFGLK